MSGWVTVFDVASEPFRWGEAGEGLWALSILTLGMSRAVVARRRSLARAALVLAVAGAAAGAVLWSSLAHYREHAVCVQAARHGAGRVVEGVVRDYHPLTSYWQRPAEETFTLSGDQVRVELLNECGYRLTALDRGPLRDGLRVRLLSWEGHILRVEVDRDMMLRAQAAPPRF